MSDMNYTPDDMAHDEGFTDAESMEAFRLDRKTQGLPPYDPTYGHEAFARMVEIALPVKSLTGSVNVRIIDANQNEISGADIAEAINRPVKKCKFKPDDRYTAGCNGKPTTYSVEFKYCRYCGGEIEL